MGRKIDLAPSFAQTVRDAARRFKEFSAAELSIEMNIQTRADMERLRRCIRDLRRDGTLQTISRGRYMLTQKGERAQVRRRVLRAMSHAGIFCAREIARAAGCDRSYVYATIRTLIADNDLETVGYLAWAGGTAEKRFRVRNGPGFYLKHVLK